MQHSIFYSIVVNAITIRNNIQYVNATFLQVLEEQWSSTSWSWHIAQSVSWTTHRHIHQCLIKTKKWKDTFTHSNIWRPVPNQLIDGTNGGWWGCASEWMGPFLLLDTSWRNDKVLSALSTLMINCCLEGTLSKR